MRFGAYCANFGCLGNARTLIDLALLAEDSGWDGFFVFDHIIPYPGERVPSVDPWTVLAVVADRTELVLGPMVTGVARRQPWELAHQIASIDRLAGGRLVLGVGLGVAPDFDAFGDTSSRAQRGDRLDEGLSLLRRFFSDEPVNHEGAWTVVDARLAPAPAGPVPIWVAARYGAGRPVRRAATYDGFFPLNTRWDPADPLTPAQLTEMLDAIRRRRGDLEGFDVVHAGMTPSSSAEIVATRVQPYAAAGVTWWLETLEPRRATLAELRERIRIGPPRPS